MNLVKEARIAITIVAVFDEHPAQQGLETAIPVFPMKQLIPFIVEHEILLGIIALSDEIAAQRAADLLILGGIRGILSVAAARLCVPKQCLAKYIKSEQVLQASQIERAVQELVSRIQHP